LEEDQTKVRIRYVAITSHNAIENNTLAGIYLDTIQEDDQTGTSAIVDGDNTFSGNEFANPTQ
jgi:hypothetical protein